MLGEAMSDRVRSGYTSSYSSDSSYSGNNSSPVDAAWSQFHKDLNTTYNIALKDEQAKREQRQHDYAAKLSQLRAQQQTGETKPQIPASRLRPQYSAQANRQTTNSNHNGNSNFRYGGSTASSQSSSNSKSGSEVNAVSASNYPSSARPASEKCTSITPPIATHSLPTLSTEGKDHLAADGAVPSLLREVDEYMQNTCGNKNYRVEGQSSPSFSREIIEKGKMFNRVRLSIKGGQRFSCLCTPGESVKSPGRGVAK
jgi:hypothetical protein